MLAPELVIFDCDGVLIDSEVLAFRSMLEVLAQYNIRITAEDAMKRYTGRSEADTLADIEAEYGIELPPAYLIKKRGRTAQLFETDLKAFPGITKLVDALRTKKCVASGSSPERLRHSLRIAGLWDRFAPHIFSATQVENGKPAPDLFLYAAKRMQVSPENCLVIEDSAAGVQAARAAGMRVYGFAGGSHCDKMHGERLLREGAEKVFHHIDELAKTLPMAGAPEAAHG